MACWLRIQGTIRIVSQVQEVVLLRVHRVVTKTSGAVSPLGAVTSGAVTSGAVSRGLLEENWCASVTARAYRHKTI